MGPRGTRAVVTALVIIAVTALAGCGIIGNPLAGRTAPSKTASAAPTPSASPTAAPLPEAGQCHNTEYAEQIEPADDVVVDCAGVHIAETVYVSRFAGAAGQGNPPLLVEGATGASATIQNDAYADCATHADQYLGHSWIHMLLALRIVLPGDGAWKAGQRWYRCDLYQLDWTDSSVATRIGSLKTSWIGPTCVNENIDDVPIVPCTAKHPGEFVGGFMLPATLKKEPKTQKELDPYYTKCWKVMATYLGVTSRKAESLVGVYLWWQYDPTFWASGRRAAWCFTWTGASSKTYVTGSAKGRGGKGL